MPMIGPAATFAEQDFYLQEFYGKSLLFALRAPDLRTATDLNTVEEIWSRLLANETRVLAWVETSGVVGERRRMAALSERLAHTLNRSIPVPTVLPKAATEDFLLSHIWTVFRNAPLFIGLWPVNAGGTGLSFLTCIQRLAVRLKVYKLILLDSAGGIMADGGRISFMNGPVLHELLRQGEAEWAGLGIRRPVLEAIHIILAGGVSSVSLCTVSNLARELFTYEGCGTLFTLTDYCRVDKLGIDDFYEVERLIQRGEQEGYLKTRTPQETTQLLLHGYGARLGSAPSKLAGFCALLPYLTENAGEVVGLYTITRFQGEGIGGQLITKMIAEGEQAGLRYLFACTTQEGARRLFERHGFQLVAPEAVPAAKWQGYEPKRKTQIAVFRRELPRPEPCLELR